MMQKETKKSAGFLIEPSFKADMEKIFSEELGMGWAPGVRFVLREYRRRIWRERQDAELARVAARKLG